MASIANYFSSSRDVSTPVSKQPTTTKKSRADRLQKSKFKPEWTKVFPFIIYKDGAMYCTDCQTAGLSNTFTMGCNAFLKDNIVKHVKTADHKRAIQAKTLRPTWDTANAVVHKQHEKDVTIAMTNVFWMAKHNQPNQLFNSVTELLDHHVRYFIIYF